MVNVVKNGVFKIVAGIRTAENYAKDDPIGTFSVSKSRVQGGCSNQPSFGLSGSTSTEYHHGYAMNQTYGVPDTSYKDNVDSVGPSCNPCEIFAHDGDEKRFKRKAVEPSPGSISLGSSKNLHKRPQKETCGQ